MTMAATSESVNQSGSSHGGRGCLIPFIVLACVVGFAWFAFKPGIHSIPPMGFFPEGRTFMYHSRPDSIAVVSSTDSICLANRENVTPLCRFGAVQIGAALYSNKIIELPYLHIAYLLSTGGRQFD